MAHYSREWGAGEREKRGAKIHGVVKKIKNGTATLRKKSRCPA
jgi:hypothetical protein